ncbi:MAG: DUF47 domain-containing protein [Deltaproteobacteria bacterium]|nr:DUF47 domain-containing protein [Deltaproteobacteria bacterium]
MFRALLPRDTSFFDFFEKHAALTVEGAKEFLALTNNSSDLDSRVRRVKEIEHETDVITHQCVEALHKTFITPIDRDDIHRLISRMDDVMDLLDAAAERIKMYEIRVFTRELKTFAEILVHATLLVERAVKGLRNLKASEEILKCCIEINRLENDADALFRTCMAQLLNQEKDAIVIIKWKEVYETLEFATDRCEDVANIVEGILLEHA